MIVMMHFGSWANCSITTGYEPFPTLFSRLCFWSKRSDRDSNLELPLKKEKKKGKKKSLKLREYSWLKALCTLKGFHSNAEVAHGVQSGEVKTAEVFDGIFLKGFSFAWEGWRKKTHLLKGGLNCCWPSGCHLLKKREWGRNERFYTIFFSL